LGRRVTHRLERAAQEIRDRLARVLAHRVRDPRLELVTLTDVELSPDFSFARVYYRPMGDPEAAQRALEHAKPFIRRGLAEGLKLRRVPELDFRLDGTPEKAARVEEILEELEHERGSQVDPPEEGG
jgi:ribosome-binding factor A